MMGDVVVAVPTFKCHVMAVVSVIDSAPTQTHNGKHSASTHDTACDVQLDTMDNTDSSTEQGKHVRNKHSHDCLKENEEVVNAKHRFVVV